MYRPKGRRDSHACRTDDTDRRIEGQKTKNNLIGLVAAIIFLAFAFDWGGIATSLARYLFKG